MQIPLPIEPVKPSKKRNSYRKKRRQIRLGLRWALRFFLLGVACAILSVLCVFGYRTLLSSNLLRVTRIQVSGCRQLDVQAVIQQAEIPYGVNILSLDLDDVRLKLTSHPWIAEALISREIPDRIRIEIKERQPVALLKGPKFQLMDSQGVCFASAGLGDHPDLPIITAPVPERPGADCTLPREFIALFEDLHRESHLELPWRFISEIRWNERTGLSIFMVRGGIKVVLGSSKYGPKIARMKKVLSYLEERGIHTNIRGIDLSHGNRVFVRGNFQVMKRDRKQQRGV